MQAWLSKFIAESVLKLAGFRAWIATQILNYGGSLLAELFADLFRKAKRAKEQEEARQKLDEVVKNPDSTVDDIGEEIAKTINSGK
jgi:hypothetical protein